MKKPRRSYTLLIALVVLGESARRRQGEEKETPPVPPPTEGRSDARTLPRSTESVEGPAEGTEPPGMLTAFWRPGEG
jgi:hypothetical protein